VINKAFTVLTEFRFEAGSAIANTGALQSAVQGVSNAADQALISFEKLTLGIGASFTGGGGILGIFATAIQSSEKFLQTQVALANVLGRGSGSFADRMDFADKKMGSIIAKAREFGLPAEALAGITKVLTPILAPKLGGSKAIDTSIDLGRSFLKAAPTLGMDPFMAQDNLQRAMLGNIDAGDQLFMTLTQDTKAMQGYINNAEKFRKLPLLERIKLLTAALEEFSGDTAVVERMINSVGGQMQILKDSLTGLGSILKTLGDVLSRTIVQILTKVNKFIQNDLAIAVQRLALVIEPFTRDLKSLYATIMQLRSLKSDLNSAGSFIFKIGALVGIGEALAWLGIKIPVVSTALAGLIKVVNFFSKSVIGGKMGVFLAGPAKGFLGFLNGFFVVLTKVFVPLLLVIGVLQFLSRVAAKVKIIFAETLLGFMNRFTEIGLLMGRISAVFIAGFDELARLAAVSPVMDMLFWFLDKFVSSLHFVTKAVALAMSTLQGVGTMISLIMDKPITELLESSALGDAFDIGTQDMLADLFPEIASKIDDGTGLSGQTVNIGKVEIKNDFKDLMEPDRVAFTIRDQLLKAAMNSTGSKVTNFGSSQKLATGGSSG